MEIKSRTGIKQFLQMVVKIGHGFFIKGGFQKANALAYSFLMSFVPFLISVASIMTLIVPTKVFNRYENRLFTDSLPVIGKQVAHYVQNFQHHALDLSIISLMFLFITALLMINTLRYNLDQLLGFNESDLNIGIRLILIIAVFGLLILTGIALLGVHEVIRFYLPKYGIKRSYWWIIIIQYFSSIIAFSLIYKFVPHTRIKFKYALFSGSIVAFLFEFAKFCFAIYIRSFSHTQNILYGSLAAIPLFLFWLYIISVIFLLGAQIIACLWLEREDQPQGN